MLIQNADHKQIIVNMMKHNKLRIYDNDDFVTNLIHPIFPEYRKVNQGQLLQEIEAIRQQTE